MKERDGERILMAHGGGGVLMHELIGRIAGRFGGEGPMQDSALIDLPGGRIAFTTDSYVVSPLFFPGGDIGRLAVCGTVNDLAVCGARPRWISLAMIVEEGLDIEVLDRVAASVDAAAREADVRVVTGDTKVVERGKADGLFINTAGIGEIPPGVDVSTANALPGDVVIVSGTIGDHGLALLSVREGIAFGGEIESDTAPLSSLIVPLLEARPGVVRAMRDATRGGLAAVLNEIAVDAGVCVRVESAKIPVRESVRRGCELMGYDPLHIANEGKFVLIVDPAAAGAVVEAMRGHELGRDAAAIGRITDEEPGLVVLKTGLGGERVVDLPYGDILPRIC
ncbi:MAG: hydrogenase expression/formation protein HypE [Candidatus Krumholzibacteriota bacterium]|nr:hydrogenase expression/formation protein HypE [Candidatus Krumholzibacteriota bacterium]